MSFPDLQSFMKLLDERGELLRVSTLVSRELEITEIADRLVKKGGPALLFENVKGSPFPLAIGLLGTPERVALSLGLPNLDALAVRVRDLIDLSGAKGLGGMLSQLPKLRDAMNLPPRRVKKAASQEVIWRGDQIDLGKIPVLKCWPLDGGPFVTLPLVITKDPETGERNMGMYRMQVMGPKETGMHWQRHKTGARHLEKARNLGRRLEVASSSSKAISTRRKTGRPRGRSATTPASTRCRSCTRASTSRRLLCDATRCTRRPSWAARRWRTPT